MLVGNFKHNIDDKNRAAVPLKFRAALGESFIITKGLDKCLFIMSYEEWDAFQAKMKELSYNDFTLLSRRFAGSAVDVTPDSQGRVCFGQKLTDFAGLSGQVVFVGATSRVEVWNADIWESKQDEITDEDIIPLLEKIHF